MASVGAFSEAGEEGGGGLAIVSVGTGLTLSGAGALTNDLSTGKAGGQSVVGGTAASDDLTISTTSNGTKGRAIFGSTAGMVYNEALAALGIGGVPIANVGPLQLVGAGGAEATLFANIYSMIGFKNADIYIGVRETVNNIEAAVGASSTGTNRARMGALTNHALALVTNNVDRLTVGAAGGFTVADANDVAVGTGTGTKLGTATTQKLGLWNATPVIQPATAGTTTGFTANASANAVFNESTFTGGTGTKAYTISDIVLALKQSGMMAAS